MGKKTIIILLLCSVVIWVWLFIATYYGFLRQEEERELETMIEQLQIKNDSLRFNNELLDSLISTQRTIVDSLSKEVQITNRVINKLKNVRYEKIRAIDSLDNNELLEFFSGFESTDPDN